MNSDAEKEVKVCEKCFSSITKERKRLDLKHYFEASKKSPFVLYYEELYFIKSVVEKKFPKYKALINQRPTVTSIEQAKELDTSLLSYVKDLELTLKRIDTFKVSTKKQQAVRDTIKGAFAQYLAIVVPEFRILHKQLEATSKGPLSEDVPVANPVSTTPPNSRYSLSAAFSSSLSSFKTILRKNDATTTSGESRSEGPFIEAIRPLLCPLHGGTTLTINGKGFGSLCSLMIGDIAAPCISQTDTEIIAIAPPHDSPGFKDVCVENGDFQYTLSQMLIYSDNEECFDTPPMSVNVPAQNTELTIELLNPVISPLGGTKMAITVKGRLSRNATIKISGVAVSYSTSQQEPNTLYFVSPPLSSGPKTVEIVNPDGRIATLENVLLYEDLSAMDHTTNGRYSSGTFGSISPQQYSYTNDNGVAKGSAPQQHRKWGKK